MYGHPSMPRHPYVLCSRYHCQRAGIRPSGQKEGHANGSTVVLECRSKKHLNTRVRVLRYILLLDGRSYGHAVWRTHRGHYARGAWGKCEGELRVRLVGVCTAAFTLLFCPKGQYFPVLRVEFRHRIRRSQIPTQSCPIKSSLNPGLH